MFVPVLLLASAALSFAQAPSNSSDPSDPYDGAPPCAAASLLIATGVTTFPARIAIDCLQSVPIDVEGNAELIEELKLLWQFESDIAWLKNPPDTYELGATDLIGELDAIKNNLTQFDSEYEIQSALMALVTGTGNFHMNWRPDILRVFSWSRQIAIVSLSDDGKALPKIYLAHEAAALSNGTRSQISPITNINGEDVNAYLEKVAARQNYIDLDGQLNSVFFKGVHDGSVGSFILQPQYDGDYTNITFANGTSVSYENFASTTQDWDTVIDGETFFLTFCTGAISGFKDPTATEDPEAPAEKAKSDSGLIKRQQIPTSFYPTAVAQDKANTIAGYFLNTPGYEDTAVLKIISFQPGETTPEQALDFQGVAKTFFAESVKQKKQKLIIDLRENGGGATHLLFDLIMQLFPGVTPFSAQQYRVHETYAAIGDAVSEIYTSPTLRKAFEDQFNATVEQGFRDWAYWMYTTVEGKNWKDWEEYAGPFLQHDDLVTSTWRYNVSNPTSLATTEGFIYSNTNTNSTVPPFAKENIVMFTDGLCGSACASFHEELKNIIGIKSVVVGGRPRTGPMQAVTGTKGGEVRAISTIPFTAVTLINATENIGATTVLDTLILDTALVSQVLIRNGDDGARVQFQEQIRKGDPTETPLQFVYEAADCKIFYTAKSLFNPQDAWISAWKAFADEKNCVEGSTRHKSSISGGYKPYGPGPLKPGEMGIPNDSCTVSTQSRATLTYTARPTGSQSKINVSTLPIVHPTRALNSSLPVVRPTGKPSNATIPAVTPSVGGVSAYVPVAVPTNAPLITTVPQPTGTGRLVFGTRTTSGVVQFTGAASNYGPGGMVLGVVAGALAAVL